jgi:hypothetical protein
MSFCLEARVRNDGVVAGYERKGDVTSIGSLWVVSERWMCRDQLYVPWGPQCPVSAREPLAAGT